MRRGAPRLKRILATGFLLVLAAALGGYSVDHTAGTYLYDRDGRLRLFARYGQGAAAILHDIRLLLAS